MLAELGSLANLGFKIGGTILGMGKAQDAAVQGQLAAHTAANQQTEALKGAIEERTAGLGRTLGFLSPYEENGRAGMASLSDALGLNGPDAQNRYFSGFQNDPGYQATLKAGTGAIEQSQAGGGMLRSGGTLKALQDYGMRLQQSMFSDRLNRLAGIGAQGQQAAGAMAGFNNNVSSDNAGYIRDIGVADAGGTIRASNAYQRGTQNQLAMLGFGMGSAAPAANDLFGKLGSAGGLGSQLGGYLDYGSNPFTPTGARNPYYS